MSIVISEKLWLIAAQENLNVLKSYSLNMKETWEKLHKLTIL